jgi:hypothetical protein
MIFGMLMSGTIINSNDKALLSANMANIMNPQTLFNEVSIIVRDHYESVTKILYILVDHCYDYFKDSTLV